MAPAEAVGWDPKKGTLLGLGICRPKKNRPSGKCRTEKIRGGGVIQRFRDFLCEAACTYLTGRFGVLLRRPDHNAEVLPRRLAPSLGHRAARVAWHASLYGRPRDLVGPK